MGNPKSQGSPLMEKNLKKIRFLIKIAQKKGLNALNATARLTTPLKMAKKKYFCEQN